ncbi:MAG: glutathione S-transferase family protein [Magnetococcales bacterium]|nr:glutathione S-transferase family protein [Magnetococcales bacterium]NGZ07699.1 glutathione S-transferase family protein [Magnetococcales bacterium]
MELELFLFDFCPYCQRVSMIADHLGIAHQAIQLGGSDRPTWFGEISPHKTVPALRMGTVGIFDSSVIAEYLNELAQGRMLPETPLERAVCRSWIGQAGHCQGLLTQICLAASQEDFEAGRKELVGTLEKMENLPLAQGQSGFNGAELSLVDAAMAPLFTRLAHIETLHPILPSIGLERVRAWSDRLLSESVVIRSVPQNFPMRFQGFLKNKAPGGFLTTRLTSA